jgi:hypothetical protein
MIVSLDDSSLSPSILKIICPRNSFTGFSLAGIGDLNNDGFDDIAIGSLPYRGGYLTQRTYVVFGSSRPSANGSIFLDLSEMVMGKDGFVIVGAGFQVNAIGDVNNDGIADLMVSSYSDWFGKINSYLSVFPSNISAPPTYLPSSTPSIFPTNFPSVSPTYSTTLLESSNPTDRDTGSSRPPTANHHSKVPVVKKTMAPTVIFRTLVPSRIPTLRPTLKWYSQPIPISPSPTVVFIHVRRTAVPSIPITTPPSISNRTFEINRGPFTVVTLTESNEFLSGSISGNIEFVFPAPSVYYIDCRPSQQTLLDDQSELSVKLYVVIPMNNEIIVNYFNSLVDVIDLTRFPTILSMNDLSYSSNPITIFLPLSTKASVAKQQSITLVNIDDLTTLSPHNFIFASRFGEKTAFAEAQIILALGLIVAGCIITVLLTGAEIKSEEVSVLSNDNKETNDYQGELVSRPSTVDDFDNNSIPGLSSFSLSHSSSSNRDDKSLINYLVGLFSHQHKALDGFDALDDDILSHDSIISDDNLFEDSSVLSKSVESIENQSNDVRD